MHCGACLAVKHAHESGGGGGGRARGRGGAQRARAQPQQRLVLIREGRRGRQGCVRAQQAQLQRCCGCRIRAAWARPPSLRCRVLAAPYDCQGF